MREIEGGERRSLRRDKEKVERSKNSNGNVGITFIVQHSLSIQTSSQRASTPGEAASTNVI